MHSSLSAPTVTVRPSCSGDRAALERLAALDSSLRPTGALLLAEVDGALLAAVRIEDGSAIADPFAPTAHLVDLLRMLTCRLPGRDGERRRRAPARPRPRLP